MKLLFALIITLFILDINISAQTTAFTYQGRLTDTAIPQGNGSYTMKFRLYDAETGGNQVGDEQTALVTVNNGAFTAVLEFTDVPFANGQARWLEIEVSGTTLSPRQRISSSPYAIKAASATQANVALDAQKLGGVNASEYLTTASAPAQVIQNTTTQQTANFNISNNGRVGGNLQIGTPSNSAKLSVSAATANSGDNTAYFEAPTIGPNASHVHFGTTGDWYIRSANAAGKIVLQDSGGNVGIGTATPSQFYRLDVAGPVQSLNPVSTHFVAHTTGGTNSWARFYMRTTNRSWFMGTSQAFNGDQFYLVDDTGGQIRMSIQPNGGYILFPLGDVGIGTNAPQSRLEVVSNHQVNGAIRGISSGFGSQAVYGRSDGQNGAGVIGVANNGSTAKGIYGVSTSGYAGYFDGLVRITPAVSGPTTLCINSFNEIAYCSSSLRYKTNIASFISGMSLINKLKPISYNWKEGGMADVGFGAEDIAKVNPLFVTYNSNGEVEGVKYDRLSVAFVNAFKEQQQQIEEQKAINQNLQTKVEQQQQQNKAQQQQINELKQILCSLKPDAAVCKK